jgi:purine-nucleoside phosphorylase
VTEPSHVTTAVPDLSDPATDPFDVARAAAEVIADRTGDAPHDVALVLGSGWGQTADLVGRTLATIPNEDVPGFRRAAVAGHSGTMRSVAIGDTGRRALVFGTRTHYYEGRGPRSVVHTVRTAAALGCRTIVLTNGCGGLRPEWGPGTVVLLRDHINLTADSPIEGPNFVDLTDLYSPRLRAVAREVDPGLPEGVYVQFRGPHYETPAEVRMAQVIGGDLVGMSTALEAIAARQAGLEVLGVSLVTNPAAGISEAPLSHEEVIEAGQAAAERCGRLLAAVVAKI